MAEMLLAHGADPQTLNVDGATPLELAGAHGHLAVAALLRPESPISDTLFDAIDAGNLERVQQLLDEGVDLQVLDRTGSTPLHRAARAGHADIGRALLADGAEVNSGTPEGTTPLHAAVRGGHAEITEVLLSAGADVLSKESFGDTPLPVAAGTGGLDAAVNGPVFELLLDHGAPIPTMNGTRLRYSLRLSLAILGWQTCSWLRAPLRWSKTEMAGQPFNELRVTAMLL